MRRCLQLRLIALVVFLTPSAAWSVNAHDTDSALKHLQSQDAALAAQAFRLVTANAALCRELMPGTGVVVHARNQYPDSIAPHVATVFGFAAPLAIAAVVAESPAARAGLLAGDSVLAVAGIEPPPEDGDGRPDTKVRDAFENRLTALPAAAAMPWHVLRSGSALTLAVVPQPACRVRFELVPGDRLTARNNGELIQLSAGYVDLLDSGSFAAVLAHELAHSVLLHRQRLVAAGVSKGLLAEFGRSGRLNRQIERDADLLSVHLLRNAGYDPAVAVGLWERHGNRIAGGLLRSRTHDSPGERVRRLQAEIVAIPANAPIPYLPAILLTRDQPLQ